MKIDPNDQIDFFLNCFEVSFISPIMLECKLIQIPSISLLFRVGAAAAYLGAAATYLFAAVAYLAHNENKA